MNGCCEFLYLFNLIFAITGLALIGIGAHIKTEMEHYLNLTLTGYVHAPIFLIIIGAVILVIAFFGCWGIYRKSPYIMYAYLT